MALSLDTLSPDLLVEIIEWVGTDSYEPGHAFVTARGTKCLCQLAICSRRLNLATTPVLYHTFTQTGCAAVPAFTKRVLANPELGTYVKTFVGSTICEDESLDMSLYTEEDFTCCLAVIQTVSGTEAFAGEWLVEVREGNWNAVTAVLISLLPNIEAFEMESFRGEELPYMNYIIDLAARRQSAGSTANISLKNLRTISFAYSDTEMGFSFEEIVPYCKLKSVRKVFLHMDADEDFSVSSERFECEDLGFNYSSIDGDGLIEILRCFPSLKKFYYDHGGPIVGYSDFLPQKVGQAISHLRPCLEVLIITNDTQEEAYGEEEMRGIGSLAEFEKLHTVATDMTTLLGPLDEDSDVESDDADHGSDKATKLRMVDILPKSLKRLELSGCREGILGQVREVMKRKEELVPVLEEITLHYRDPRAGGGDRARRGEPHIYPGYDKDVADILKVDCKAAGFDLTVILAPM